MPNVLMVCSRQSGQETLKPLQGQTEFEEFLEQRAATYLPQSLNTILEDHCWAESDSCPPPTSNRPTRI